MYYVCIHYIYIYIYMYTLYIYIYMTAWCVFTLPGGRFQSLASTVIMMNARAPYGYIYIYIYIHVI